VSDRQMSNISAISW